MATAGESMERGGVAAPTPSTSLGARASCVVRHSDEKRRQVRFKSSGQIDGAYALMLLPRSSADTTAVTQVQRKEALGGAIEKGPLRLSWRIRMKLKARAKRRREKKIAKLPSESESGSFDSWLDSPTPQRTPIVGSESVACSGYHCSSASSSGLPPRTSSMKRSSLYIESTVPNQHSRDIGAHRRSAAAKTPSSSVARPNRPAASKVSTASQPEKRSFLRPHHLCLCGRCHVVGGTKAFLVLYAAITLGGVAFGMMSAMVWALIPMLIIPMTAYSLWRCEPKYLYPFLLITVIQMIVSFFMVVIVALFSLANFETISDIIEHTIPRVLFVSPRIWSLAVIVFVAFACLLALLLFFWQLLVISSCIHFYENRCGRGKTILPTTASDKATALPATAGLEIRAAHTREFDLGRPPATCTPNVSSSFALSRPPVSAISASSPDKATPSTLPCTSHSTNAVTSNNSPGQAANDEQKSCVGEMLLASIEMTTHTIMI